MASTTTTAHQPPRAAEELLARVGVHEIAEIVRQGPRDSRHRLPDSEEDGEEEHPPPDLCAHLSGLWIPWGPQPQGVAHPWPFECSQLAPDEDQDQHELPDEARGEADEQGLSEWLVAPELVSEQGSDDPGESPHRDGRRRPDPKDLGEGVLPYPCISIKLVRWLFHHAAT